MKCINKILIFFIIMIIVSLSCWCNVTFAATTYKQIVKSGIDSFPEEYQEKLKEIQKLHPNWTFDAYYTGIPWKTVVLNESVHERNRVIKSSESSWKCSCNNIASGYACASEGIIKYYLDPRNFLNEINIFQFLEISYNSKIHNLEGIKKAVKNTFLDSEITYIYKENEYTKTYSEIILDAAKKSNMSPYSIVTKIIQEVGTKGSDSVSGTYSGYKGYYNFYNLGAYDTGNAIANALKYAQKKNWDNQYSAIIEGAMEIANSYTNAGQNTAYFYKWDVVGTKILKAGEGSRDVSSSDMYWHQYMTNVQDPTSQSKSLFNTYGSNKILNASLNFVIPVYEDMPEGNLMPSGLTTKDGDLYYVNCTDGLRVRSSPSTSYKALTSLTKNTVVVVLERECKEANGYKWDKIKLANGTEGYAASKYLTLKEKATKDDEKQDEKDDEKKFRYEDEDNIIIMLMGITIDKITGAVGEVKTGAKITINGKKYTAVVLGDTNGDGKISSSDYVKVKNVIRGKEENSNVEDKAADVNGDGKISSADYVKIKNVIRGKETINLN